MFPVYSGESALDARIHELEQKLYWANSSGAADLYQAELTGLYEERDRLRKAEEAREAQRKENEGK